ncbi:MAG: DUF6807 family protein [Bryobacteraceae bacterium]
MTPDEIIINVDGKPFTFYRGVDANKPFLAPLRSALGGRMGRIVVRSVALQDAKRSSTLTAAIHWQDPDGKVLLIESRKMVFDGDPKLRTIDFEITLAAAVVVTLGDTREGAFEIRLADNLTAKKGGKMFDADGRTGMMGIWGKRSNWVDYTSKLDGETLGVAIFDHPQKAPSGVLARPGLRTVRAESVRPQSVRSHFRYSPAGVAGGGATGTRYVNQPIIISSQV